MEATLQQNQPTSILMRMPTWMFHAIVIIVMVAGMAITTMSTEAAAIAKATAAGEESDFELEDVYASWAYLLLAATTAEMAYFGFRRNWTFASTVQVALIVLLTVTFALMTQLVEKDVYEVGVMALIILTLIQIPFGNIPPQSNFRFSMIGLFIGGAILTAVVLFSIWLAPNLIQLGR
jgi:hypothetical protein